MHKKYYIKTFGCQANIADSGKMGGILEALGYARFTPDEGRHEDAVLEEVLRFVDLLIINSCSVRQKSEDKVYGMGKMVKRMYKETGKKPLIILAGCMVGSATGERKRIELEDLKKKMPWVDVFLSPIEIDDLPGIVSTAVCSNSTDVVPVIEDPTWAYVNISQGCDNFCTYCVVPYSRGKEVSCKREDIIKDVAGLTGRGYKRIMLCGQNVNSWGLSVKEKFEIRAGQSRPTPFPALLKGIHNLDGLEELAFISSNPFDFTQELIDTLRLPKMSKYLHIAVQSGNNDVLKRMNRRHSVEEFISLVEKIKQAVPDIELGTDIIVGFPGETEEQFMDTVKLIQSIRFNVCFISLYSPRKGTLADKLYKDDIPLKEKKRRHALITKVWRESLNKCQK